MLKSQELLQPTSCLNKAAPDELVFVLRAKDPLAPMTLRHWAAMAHGRHEPEKIAEALAFADAMEKWRAARYDKDGTPWQEAEQPMPVCAQIDCTEAAVRHSAFCAGHKPQLFPTVAAPAPTNWGDLLCVTVGCGRPRHAQSDFCRDHTPSHLR